MQSPEEKWLSLNYVILKFKLLCYLAMRHIMMQNVPLRGEETIQLGQGSATYETLGSCDPLNDSPKENFSLRHYY